MHALLLLTLLGGIKLEGSTDGLEVVTTSTSAIDYVVTASNVTATALTTPVTGVGQITTATTTTVLAAPSASNWRELRAVSLYNSGAASNTVTVQVDRSAGNRILCKTTLAPAARLLVDGDGLCRVYAPSGGEQINLNTTNIGGRPYTWTKSATATDTAGYHYAFFKDTGMPGAYSLGTPGLNGVATDCSVVGTAGTGGALTTGSPLFTSAASGSLYLRSVQLTAAAIGTYQLIDVMWVNSGLVVTTTTAQTTTSPALPARDSNGSTNGEGVEFALLTTTANTNAAAISNGSISYTDSDGNAGATGAQFALVSYQTTISPVIGTWTPFYYAAGNRGIRALASVTLGTSYVAGALSGVLYRPIATVGVTVANNPTTLVPEISPRLYNGSCLVWVAIGNPATTAPAITAATIQVVER
jgi:hypothetical protein